MSSYPIFPSRYDPGYIRQYAFITRDSIQHFYEFGSDRYLQGKAIKISTPIEGQLTFELDHNRSSFAKILEIAREIIEAYDFTEGFKRKNEEDYEKCSFLCFTASSNPQKELYEKMCTKWEKIETKTNYKLEIYDEKASQVLAYTLKNRLVIEKPLPILNRPTLYQEALYRNAQALTTPLLPQVKKAPPKDPMDFT